MKIKRNGINFGAPFQLEVASLDEQEVTAQIYWCEEGSLLEKTLRSTQPIACGGLLTSLRKYGDFTFALELTGPVAK